MTDKKGSAEFSVKWDDSSIRSSYANVCNVISTREEVSMMFGMNQHVDNENKEVVIELSEKIVLNPYAAKRVALLLNNVIDQYETKYGAIELESDANKAAQKNSD